MKNFILKLIFCFALFTGRNLAQTPYMVKNISPGGGSIGGSALTPVANGIKFAAVNALWFSDGTLAGTNFVKDIYPGPTSSSISSYFDAGLGNIYFVANDGTSGQELWKSDGTPAGTQLVKDIKPGSGASNITFINKVNNIVFFMAD